MYTGLVLCRTGMGSSMMLRIKLDQVIRKNNYPVELEHDVISTMNSHHVDFVITMKDLVEELQAQLTCPIYGVENLMDKVELKGVLDRFLATKAEQ